VSDGAVVADEKLGCSVEVGLQFPQNFQKFCNCDTSAKPFTPEWMITLQFFEVILSEILVFTLFL